jgi:hypothetical protein
MSFVVAQSQKEALQGSSTLEILNVGLGKSAAVTHLIHKLGYL